MRSKQSGIMKRAILILPIILFILFESCNEDFNVNAPFQNVYTLNCILRNDNPIQYAIISKNIYTESGATPTLPSTAQNIKGANVEIYYDDSVFVMRDTTIQVADSGNTIQVNCYYLRNLVMKPGKIISIKATTPDGQILKSTKQIPVFIQALSDFPQTYYTNGAKEYYVTVPGYPWVFKRNNKEINDMLSFPRFEIDYEKYEGGTYVNKKKFVPLSYYRYMDNNGFILSPDLDFSFNYVAYTSLKTVNKTMQEISGSDPFKKNYIITRAFLSITSMDPELTRYYYAHQVFSNSFTIKLRPTEYSNIQGGKGIFGIYYIYTYSLDVDKDYIDSFGYQYDPSR
jgi:hypothetical protein